MTDEKPELKSKGVSSVAFGPDNEERKGHVLLIDYDDYDFRENERVMDLIDSLPGISMLIESSPGSEHIWNLSVRGLDETALKLLKFKSDPMRTMLGYRWRPPRWVSRTHPKEYDDGTVETKAPKVLGIMVNETTLPQSKGHWAIANTFLRNTPKQSPEDVPGVHNWVETTVQMDAYRALSPAQKEGGD